MVNEIKKKKQENSNSCLTTRVAVCDFCSKNLYIFKQRQYSTVQMASLSKIQGTLSPLQTLKFIKKPKEFLIDSRNKYGDIYWFKLGSQKLYVTSNSELASKILESKIKLFEPDPISDIFGKKSILLNDSDNSFERKIFIRTISEFLNSLVKITDNYLLHLNIESLFIYSLHSKNIVELVNKILLDILTHWIVQSENCTILKLNNGHLLPSISMFHWKRFFDNLSADLLFSKNMRKLKFIKWSNLKKDKIIIDTSLEAISLLKGSIPNKFIINGLSKESSIQQTFLLLFAAYDNISITICNLLLAYSEKFINFPGLHDVFIDECLINNKPVLILPHYLNESVTFESDSTKYKFPIGTNIAVDLLNTNISAFGLGSKKCPGEIWARILIQKITAKLALYFRGFENIKYGRIRFSWGPISFNKV